LKTLDDLGLFRGHVACLADVRVEVVQLDVIVLEELDQLPRPVDNGGGGSAELEISTDKVEILFQDKGPGIADLELAMTEGYSTASEEVRSMGFGAGMGMPNMKRNADSMIVDSEPGAGTRISLMFNLSKTGPER